MEALIPINPIDKDCIEIIGVKYFSEDYIVEMMRREYQRGLKEGQGKPVIHKVEIMNFDETGNLIASKHNTRECKNCIHYNEKQDIDYRGMCYYDTSLLRFVGSNDEACDCFQPNGYKISKTL